MSSTRMLARRVDMMLAAIKARQDAIYGYRKTIILDQPASSPHALKNVFIYRKGEDGQAVLSPEDLARYEHTRGVCIFLPEKDQIA